VKGKRQGIRQEKKNVAVRKADRDRMKGIVHINVIQVLKARKIFVKCGKCR
jgi:hypothetical protein